LLGAFCEFCVDRLYPSRAIFFASFAAFALIVVIVIRDQNGCTT
jgi:hypothetical protein